MGIRTAFALREMVPIHASMPTLPRHIALVNVDGDNCSSAIAFILDDFEEAFNVYARHDADPDARISDITHLDASRTSEDGMEARPSFDTVILGYDACENDLPGRIANQLHDLLTPGMRLYAIATAKDHDPELAASSFKSLETFCSEYRLSWCGGLAVGASDMIPAIAKTPRMGMVRRRLSEATDKLILAVRCGTDAGALTAPAPVPRFAYRLFANKLRRSSS